MNESNSAVYLEASTVAIVNSTFSNDMDEQGAGLVCFKGTIAFVSGCLFESNQASSQAGAIAVITQSQLIASDTVFKSNTALVSGAVGTSDGSSAELTNVSCICTADSLIIIQDLSCYAHEVLHALFSEGTMTMMIILLYACSLMLQCHFLNNTAQNAGALIAFQSTRLGISGCSFEGNAAGNVQAYMKHNTVQLIYHASYTIS
jgi:hypothetical protein